MFAEQHFYVEWLVIQLKTEAWRMIFQMYEMTGEPGIYIDDKGLNEKTQAGEPMSRERARLRKQCKPKGPIGFLFETIHLQASCMASSFTVHQWNQPSVNLL